MKKTRIKYKKLLLWIIGFLCICGASLYGLFWAFNWFHISKNYTGGSRPTAVQYYLFIGTDENQNLRQADSLLLIAINQQRQMLYAISLPGNTRINRNEEPLLLLRDAYTEGSAEKTVSAVENLLHIRIDRYAMFDAASFAALIDDFNGLDFYVEQNMRHRDVYGTEDFALRQGFQTLDGQNAYSYLRFIEPEEGEIGRIHREERFFKALLIQNKEPLRLLSWGLTKKYWNSPDTNISNSEAASVVYTVLDFPSGNYHFSILPGEIKEYENQKVWEINPVEVQKVIEPIMAQ